MTPALSVMEELLHSDADSDDQAEEKGCPLNPKTDTLFSNLQANQCGDNDASDDRDES